MNTVKKLPSAPLLSTRNLDTLVFKNDYFLFIGELDEPEKQNAIFLQTINNLTPHLLLKASDLPNSTGAKTQEEIDLEERKRNRSSGISSFIHHPTDKKILIPHRGALHIFCYESRRTTSLPIQNAVFPKWSPCGQWIVYIQNKDVYSYSLQEQTVHQLTYRTSEFIWNGLSEFVAQEEMDRLEGFWILPDSSAVLFAQVNHEQVETFHIQDSATPELPPKQFFYPRPGKNNAKVTLGIVPIRGGVVQWVPWDDINFPYLAKVVTSQHAPLTILVQSRDQKKLCIMMLTDIKEWKIIRQETSTTWINLKKQVPVFFPDGQSFFWTTENNQGTSLIIQEVASEKSRTLFTQSTHFSDFLHFNPETQEIFFKTTPVSYQQLIAKASLLSPENIQILTPLQGTHQAIFGQKYYMIFSEDLVSTGAIYLANYTNHHKITVSNPVETIPLSLCGEIISVGSSHLTAFVMLPQNSTKEEKIPVILDVYGGPGRPKVRETTSVYHEHRYFAQAGFAVVSIDGRGTPYKGHAFEHAIDGDFSTVTVQDQIEGLMAILDKYPILDKDKIGVRGWSFGGYMSALLVMKHPEIFKGGIGGAPPVDWLDYDTHYTERYLGIPQPGNTSYEKSSLLSYAHLLKRPFLLAHGTADDNVYFLHSLKLSQRLFQHKIDHDFLPLVGSTHMLDGPTRQLFLEASLRFFQKCLQGIS